MSGVIDEDGQQWEHCHACGGWEQIELLTYEEPTEEFEYGRDLCVPCWLYPETREARRIAELAKADQDKAAFDEMIFPTVCGHGAKSSDSVMRFEDIPQANPNIESSKIFVYCSETCAQADGR